MEQMVKQWAYQIKKQVPDHPASAEVIAYGLTNIINVTTSVTLLIILGVLLNILNEMLALILSFFVLRFFTGGVHMSNPLTCWAVTVVAFILAAYVPYSPYVSYVLLTISSLILWKYSYYLEPYQSKRALRYKNVYLILAFLWIGLGYVVTYFQILDRFSYGVFLQLSMITPIGVRTFRKIDHFFKGGETK